MRKIFLLFILSLFPVVLLAQENADTTKSQYHLFKPTPRKLMRGFDTDRPDITESAYSVDAGHFQFETDLFKTVQNKEGGIKSVLNFYNLINLKLGITNSADFQVVVSSYETEKVSGAQNYRTEDFGATTLRLKQNLWGNDKGNTALAILPYINIPSSGNEKVSYGMAIPFAASLNNDWGFGAQIQVDAVESLLKEGKHLNYLASITFAHPLATKTNFFVESYATQETEINRFEYFFNGGIIFLLGDYFKLDVGFNYGFKDYSNKVFFTGLSFRY